MLDALGHQFFQDMCIHAGVALIATDEQLRIRFWNPAAARMLGGSAEAMLGQPIGSIVPAERRALAERLCSRALTHAETSELDFQYHNAAGEPMVVAVTISPVIDPNGRRTGVSVYVRDVTRRMILEREMAEHRKMSALGSMAGQVAHHFNNVLGGIITSLDFAQSSDEPDVLHRAMHTTISALTRANSITQGLLAFAEGYRGASAMSDVAELVGQFASELEPRLAAQNIRLELDIEAIEALLPARQMLTILENLTANAREAMPGGGTLRIELQLFPGEPKGILRVIDTGCGIPPEHLPRVFEPFFTTKDAQDSTSPPDRAAIQSGGCSTSHAGMGLAIVHGIVKEMGGSVTVSSRPGGGTACSVILPLKLK
ncbi:MAG TPA: ATP-binding protein [Phycisphaerae bacterium]|jgi:PAS domain S-box-containing protein|nr:ATP-binding protein [Phycisphaerae bacterium]HOJ56235.1 ATP-binding protein [Phycisphaerae bacterium]HOL27117.1 ATP-binding protein [Phycisphaerae bacterium]HPP21249.1 ATP-binding protein [Phycisphaerae bacterium]HPU31802.1 ATP-binding protein [Phycisphaerae bacterium]